MKKIVTFGEILLRWSKNSHMRLGQRESFNGNYGGSEANVAVSLATLGSPVAYVTRLPDNPIGRACMAALRSQGVSLDHVVKGGDRLGCYFFEDAASLRNSGVVYDRDNSSFYSSAPGMYPWTSVFAEADTFHCSGITCAVSQSAADATFEAVEEARRMGLEVTCDINYRKNLWRYGADAHEVLHRLMQYSDFIFGDQNEWELASGMPHIPFKALSSDYELDRPAYEAYFQELHRQFPHCRRMLIALRNQISSTHHTLTGVLWVEGRIYTTHIYDIEPIIDPMGVGDAFVAAYIHARRRWPSEEQRCLDFSLAASALKNTIPGDSNLVTEAEVEQLRLSVDRGATGCPAE